MTLQSVGIVGGGAWGTALAVSARRAGRDVMLWAYEPETIAEIKQQHRNALYLPGVSLDPAIKATARLNEIAACDLVLMVTPAQEVRAIADELAPHMRTDQPLVIGAEIGGALKNVYAIAAGIVVGKKLGASAHAALVTRGFAEMMRFGAALGARRETMTGLSGLGDLTLTCGSPQSRNMSLGSALGEGRSLGEVLKSRLSVTEGVYTASAVVEIAAARGIEMPIAQAVHAVVSGLATVDEAIEALLARPLRPEG